MTNRSEYALEPWISTELMPKNRFYKAKWKYSKKVFHWLVNLFTVRFLCLRPWDCPQNNVTWEVCSWMGGGLSNALTNLCMALYCHENSVQNYKNKEQKIQWEIKQSHAQVCRSVGQVLGGVGRGGYVCPWSEFQVCSFPILRSRPCSSARLVFTHHAVSSSHIA